MVFLLSESALDTAQELGVLVHIAGVRLGRGERGEDQARRDGEEQALGHWDGPSVAGGPESPVITQACSVFSAACGRERKAFDPNHDEWTCRSGPR